MQNKVQEEESTGENTTTTTNKTVTRVTQLLTNLTV